MPVDQIQYSEKYNDDKYEYRYILIISLISSLTKFLYMCIEYSIPIFDTSYEFIFDVICKLKNICIKNREQLFLYLICFYIYIAK